MNGFVHPDAVVLGLNHEQAAPSESQETRTLCSIQVSDNLSHRRGRRICRWHPFSCHGRPQSSPGSGGMDWLSVSGLAAHHCADAKLWVCLRNVFLASAMPTATPSISATKKASENPRLMAEER